MVSWVGGHSTFVSNLARRTLPDVVTGVKTIPISGDQETTGHSPGVVAQPGRTNTASQVCAGGCEVASVFGPTWPAPVTTDEMNSVSGRSESIQATLSPPPSCGAGQW